MSKNFQKVSSNMFFCYSCDLHLEKDNMRYMCNCGGDNGICKDCEEIKMSEWKSPPDHQPMFTKIHDLTPEAEKYYKLIEEEAPNWQGIIAGKDFDIYLWRDEQNVKHEVEIPTLRGKYCTCCN